MSEEKEVFWTKEFIVGLVTAIAWIPVVCEMVVRTITKRKVNIFHENKIDLIVNEFNSFAIIRLQIYTENKNGAIEDLSLEITNPSGLVKVYRWSKIVEWVNVAYVSDTGNSISTQKETDPLAYVLRKDIVEDFRVFFNDETFRDEYEIISKKLLDDHIKIRDKEELSKTESYNAIRNLYTKYFNSFETGVHTAEIKIKLFGKKKTINKAFKYNFHENYVLSLTEGSLPLILKKTENIFIEDEKIEFDSKYFNTPMISFVIKD